MIGTALDLLTGLAAEILHLALMLAVAPLLVGCIRTLKARLLGRAGPPVMQPWRDLIRLARKRPVLAENASALFAAAPAIVFAATLAATALVPSFTLGMSTAPVADLLVIAGLLALGRCTLALAGMDVGTAFGGIGASRQMSLAVFAEPALVLVIFTLALLAGTTNLDGVAAVLAEGPAGVRASLGLAMIATLAVALSENARGPVDGPATRQELGVVRQAMMLEYSGRDLALIEGAAALKLLAWFTLIGTVFFPFALATPDAGLLAWPLGIAAWAARTAVLAVALACLETAVARMRLFSVPEFLGVALLFGLLAAVFLFVGTGVVTGGG